MRGLRLKVLILTALRHICYAIDGITHRFDLWGDDLGYAAQAIENEIWNRSSDNQGVDDA